MHIVLPLTAIKADGKTGMELKGVHGQLDILGHFHLTLIVLMWRIG